MTMDTDDPVSRVVASVASSRKYSHLCPCTLNHIATWAWARHPNLRTATKAAKRKLHQVYGSFIRETDILEAQRLVETIPFSLEQEETRSVCRQIMGLHASTRERLSYLDRLYPALLDAIDASPQHVLDMACGLHPLALPWMGLPPSTTYYACDIDQRIVETLNRFFERAGFRAKAECRDLLVGLPKVHADLVFLMKVLPGLEQQERGGASRVLGALDAEWVVLSMPGSTLSGREKGMYEYYGAMVSHLADTTGRQMREFRFDNETFYLMRRVC